MNESTKSLIRHFLTILGTIVGLVGLNSWVPVLEYLNQSLDALWASIVTIVGFATTVFGFLKDKDRFNTTVKK